LKALSSRKKRTYCRAIRRPQNKSGPRKVNGGGKKLRGRIKDTWGEKKREDRINSEFQGEQAQKKKTSMSAYEWNKEGKLFTEIKRFDGA